MTIKPSVGSIPPRRETGGATSERAARRRLARPHSRAATSAYGMRGRACRFFRTKFEMQPPRVEPTGAAEVTGVTEPSGSPIDPPCCVHHPCKLASTGPTPVNRVRTHDRPSAPRCVPHDRTLQAAPVLARPARARPRSAPRAVRDAAAHRNGVMPRNRSRWWGRRRIEHDRSDQWQRDAAERLFGRRRQRRRTPPSRALCCGRRGTRCRRSAFSSITSDGRTTIPEEILELFHIQTGEQLE
jgi:hypothetical protein